MNWKNIYRGLAMGISDLIPGVSGGTIAVILGIYDQLIEAISGFFSKDWKKHFLFLFPLGIGVGTALLLLSRLIEFLLHNYYAPTQFFFMGLIVGILPLLSFELRSRTKINKTHVITIILATIVVASMAFIKPSEAVIITDINASTATLLFFSGWLGSMAMLLPGISGSFVLLLIGVYPTAINALSTLNFPVILLIGSGVIVGFIVSSKVIRFLLAHYPGATFSVIIGLVIGSLAVVFPGLPTTTGLGVASVITFVSGLWIVRYLSRFA